MYSKGCYEDDVVSKKHVFLKFEMAENLYNRKLTSYSVLNLSWPRESNGTSFLKIGQAVQKLCVNTCPTLTSWWR